MVNVTRPRNEDVRKVNSLQTLYVFGDENTDGSIRIIPDLVAGTEVELQQRENGVWNDTGLVIAASTVYLGRELRLSGGGRFLLTKDLSEEIRALNPHVEYDETNGSDEFVSVPRLGAFEEEWEFQTDVSGVVSGDPVTWMINWSPDNALVSNIYLIPATTAGGNVTLTIRRGGTSGDIFFTRTYPQSDFVAGVEVTLSSDGFLEFMVDDVIYFELEDAGGTLSLQGEITGNIPYLEFDRYVLVIDTITPDEQGGATKYLMFDNDGHTICDNTGQAVLAPENGVEITPVVAEANTPYVGAMTFDDDVETEELASVPISLYRYTGTTGSTLTLSDTSKGYVDGDTVWQFTVKDEGGNCTDEPLTIQPESGTIDGAASIQLQIDFGSVLIYSDGTNYWSI